MTLAVAPAPPQQWTKSASGLLIPAEDSVSVGMPSFGSQDATVITPTLSADQNNWDPTGVGNPFQIVSVSTNDGTTRVLTGIVAPVAGQTKWLLLRVPQSSPGHITIFSLDGSSDAANRVRSPIDPTPQTMLRGSGILLYHDGTNWKTVLASLGDALPATDGTAGQLLSTGALGAPMSWVTPAGGGALIKVSSSTLGAAAASVTISGFDSTSRLWLVVLSKLQPADVNKQLQMEMRLGGSFPSDFKMQFHTMVHGSAQAGYAGINGSAAERILLSNAVLTNDADFAGNLAILISNPGATDERKTLRYRGEFWIDSAPNKIQIVVGVGGHEALSSALDAIKIRYNTGNVAAGLIQDVYKYDTP